MLLLVLLLACMPVLHERDASAQTTTTYTLYFHNYSLMLSDPNGSFCVYDGADCSPPTSSTPTQVTLNSQTTGTATVDGFTTSYWSAAIVWALKLPADLTVDGSVDIKAYISSTYKISGLLSGGGYGMGLVDIDQNDNEVQQFITQAPYTEGGNPFTSTPTQYSVSTNIDYTFKAGHYIGFAVGVGATSKGFTATVYFDSLTYSSGATLPVEGSASWLNPTPTPPPTTPTATPTHPPTSPTPSTTTTQPTTSSTSPSPSAGQSSTPTESNSPSGETSPTGTSTQPSTSGTTASATGTASGTPSAGSSTAKSTPSPSPTQPANTPTIPEYASLAAITILAGTALTAVALKKRRTRRT